MRSVPFRRKVVIGFAAAALLVAVVTATSAVALKLALDSDRATYRRAEELLALASLRSALSSRVASFRGYLMSGEPRFLDKLREGRSEVLSNLRRLRSGAVGEDVSLLKAVEEADEGYEAAAAEGIRLRTSGASAEELGQYIERTSGPRGEAVERALGAYRNHKRDELREAERRSARQTLGASLLILVTGGTAFLLVIVLAAPVTRTLAALYETESRERARAEASEAAQRRLAELERAILDSLPGPVAVLDGNGMIVSVNEPWKRFGKENGWMDPNFGVGTSYVGLCEGARGSHAEGAAAVASGIRNVLEGRADRFDDEYESSSPDVERWFRLLVSPLREHTGGGAVIMHLDITPRKRAERAVKDSEVRKTAILESALEAIVTIDRAGDIVEFNPAAESTFGYTRGEAIGRRMADLIIPTRLREAHAAGLARHLQTGESRILARRLEMPALRSDGSEFDAELTITRIATEPVYFTGFVRDVSELRRAERERAELLARERAARAAAEADERRSAFLAEAGGVLASSLDYRTTLASVARLAVPEFGDWCFVDVAEGEGELQRLAICHADPAKVAIARDMAERYPEAADAPYGPARVVRTREAEIAEEITDEILREYAHDAEHLAILERLGFCSYITVPLLVRDRALGALTFVNAESGVRYGPVDVAFAEDLARRASIAIDNARLYREAREAIAARDDFLSIASHELKTPVTTLQLQVQSLGRSLDAAPGELAPPVLSERLRGANRQMERLTRLINELLDISRITGRGLELELEPVDLAAIVREVVARHEADLSRARCPMQVEVHASTGGVWDRMRVEQVVTNLLSNAIKYGAGRPIEVSVDGDETLARLTVRDHGIGIAPEHQARIFQRFERAVSGSHYGGFGLGLWIVRQIVDAHGGDIRVSSAPRDGSTFVVELPRAPRGRQDAGPPAPPDGYT